MPKEITTCLDCGEKIVQTGIGRRVLRCPACNSERKKTYYRERKKKYYRRKYGSLFQGNMEKSIYA